MGAGWCVFCQEFILGSPAAQPCIDVLGRHRHARSYAADMQAYRRNLWNGEFASRLDLGPNW